MSENSMLDTAYDDTLVDEALDRTDGGKFRACSGSACRVGSS